jgi:hypothetical protein
VAPMPWKPAINVPPASFEPSGSTLKTKLPTLPPRGL